MERRAFLGAMGTGAAVAAAGCLTLSTASDDAAYQVGMNSHQFLPQTYEASVGETVVWKNTSSRAHTVTGGIPNDDDPDDLPEGASYFASGGFDSEAAAEHGWLNGLQGAIEPGTTYEHTFEVAGTFPYFCVPHWRAGMTGTIVVTE